MSDDMDWRERDVAALGGLICKGLDQQHRDLMRLMDLVQTLAETVTSLQLRLERLETRS